MVARLKDPATWALHIANHPHHCVADFVRDIQAEAMAFGAEAGKQEFLRIATDTDKRINQLTGTKVLSQKSSV